MGQSMFEPHRNPSPEYDSTELVEVMGREKFFAASDTHPARVQVMAKAR